jgi:hypothetical protein
MREVYNLKDGRSTLTHASAEQQQINYEGFKIQSSNAGSLWLGVGFHWIWRLQSVSIVPQTSPN